MSFIDRFYGFSMFIYQILFLLNLATLSSIYIAEASMCGNYPCYNGTCSFNPGYISNNYICNCWNGYAGVSCMIKCGLGLKSVRHELSYICEKDQRFLLFIFAIPVLVFVLIIATILLIFLKRRKIIQSLPNSSVLASEMDSANLKRRRKSNAV